jgi:hypothetical protein
MNQKIVYLGAVMAMSLVLLGGSFAIATGYSTFGIPSLAASVLTAFKIPYSFYEQQCRPVRYGYLNRYGYTKCQSIHRYGYKYEYRFSYGYSVTPVPPPTTKPYSPTATGTALTLPCPLLTLTLAPQSTDASTSGQVTLLQKFLMSRGRLSVQPSGYMGSSTIQALLTFQKNQSLPLSSSVGPITRARINAFACNQAK